MIRSFGNKDTERLRRRERVPSIDPRIHRVELRKLRQVGSAEAFNELRIPSGNRLEALKGDQTGQHSMSINDQWRICFVCGQMLDQRRWRSLITTDKLAPIHPGEVLREDFIEGIGITQNKFAVSIGVPPRRINDIVHGKPAITADTAVCLGKYLGTSVQFWLNLQSHYDLDLAEDRVADEVAAIVPLQGGWRLSGESPGCGRRGQSQAGAQTNVAYGCWRCSSSRHRRRTEQRLFGA